MAFGQTKKVRPFKTDNMRKYFSCEEGRKQQQQQQQKRRKRHKQQNCYLWCSLHESITRYISA